MLCKFGLRGTLGEGLSCSELGAVFVFVEDSEGGVLGVGSEEDSGADDKGRAEEALGWGTGYHCSHKGSPVNVCEKQRCFW